MKKLLFKKARDLLSEGRFVASVVLQFDPPAEQVKVHGPGPAFRFETVRSEQELLRFRTKIVKGVVFKPESDQKGWCFALKEDGSELISDAFWGEAFNAVCDH